MGSKLTTLRRSPATCPRPRTITIHPASGAPYTLDITQIMFDVPTTDITLIANLIRHGVEQKRVLTELMGPNLHDADYLEICVRFVLRDEEKAVVKFRDILEDCGWAGFWELFGRCLGGEWEWGGWAIVKEKSDGLGDGEFGG